MKMADGGFRPAYNVQVVSAAAEQIVVAVGISNAGSDRGLMRPMLEQWHAQHALPHRHLVDAGFSSTKDIEWAHRHHVEVYCPPIQSRHGTDPYKPRPNDGAGVADWRRRMASEAGKAQYKRRSICECIHARWRNWGLRQVPVRGTEKGPNHRALVRPRQQPAAGISPRQRLARPPDQQTTSAGPRHHHPQNHHKTRKPHRLSG